MGVTSRTGVSGTAPATQPQVPGFRILEKLGEGGMGVVWLAEQTSTHRKVALKVMPEAALGSTAARQRFEREVALAAMLDHPHLAKVYESGDWRGGLFYAMEHVPGVPLDVYCQLRRPDQNQLIELIARVCEGMQHAHQRGVIHRDLKPSNILVTDEGKPVVVDFGLAKAVSGSGWSPEVTRDGHIAGTISYMAPEQAAGSVEAIDTRSDVYALGVILYELITGRLPRDTTGVAVEVIQRIADSEVVRPTQIGTRIDRDLEAVLMKALALKPDERYSSAGDFAADLRRRLALEPVVARRHTLTYLIQRKIRKHRRPLGWAAALLAILLTLTGAIYFRPAKVPIYTDPPGAAIAINGKPHFCPTNCSVYLSRGVHEIRLTTPAPVGPGGETRDIFQPIVRRVRVAWGRYSYEGTPTAVLPPAFQHVTFTGGPTRAEVVVTDETSGQEVFRGVTPALTKLDAGQYLLHGTALDGTGRTLQRNMHILGSSETRTEPLEFE